MQFLYHFHYCVHILFSVSFLHAGEVITEGGEEFTDNTNTEREYDESNDEIEPVETPKNNKDVSCCLFFI